MAIAARLPPLLLLSVLLLLHFHVSLAPTPKEEDEEDERIVRGILVCNLVLSGFFAHLSYVTNMVRYARHLGMKPFFFLHGGNFWEETYGDNWIEYFFTQPMVSEREREAIRRKVLAPYLDKYADAVRGEDWLSKAPTGMMRILPGGEVEHVEEEQRRYEETVVIPRKLRNLSSDHDIVTSFLQPKRWVLEQVQSYVERVFGGKHVLGVHYRGLDKSGRSRGEAPRVPWDEVLRAIERYRKHFPSSLVYVATDERRFIEFLSKRLPPGAMVTQEGFLRSEDAGGDAMPLWAWEFEGSPMRKGQEALVESLVLSRTSFLLRTSSLLSAFAKIFNPKLPVLLLNRQVDDFAPENYMQDDELPFPPDDVEKGRGEGGEDQEEGGAGEKAEGRQRTLEEAMDRLKSVGEEEFSLQEVDGGRRDLYLKQSNASQKIVNIVWLGRTISSPSRFYVQQTVLPQDRAWRTSWVEVERGNFSYGSFASGDVIMVICGEMGERRKNKSKASFLQRLRSWSLARGEEDASAALLVPCGPADGKYLESSESLATELVGLVDAVALLSTQLSCAEEVRGNRSTAVVRLLLGFSDMTQLVQLHSLLPAPQRQMSCMLPISSRTSPTSSEQEIIRNLSVSSAICYGTEMPHVRSSSFPRVESQPVSEYLMSVQTHLARIRESWYVIITASSDKRILFDALEFGCIPLIQQSDTRALLDFSPSDFLQIVPSWSELSSNLLPRLSSNMALARDSQAAALGWWAKEKLRARAIMSQVMRTRRGGCPTLHGDDSQLMELKELRAMEGQVGEFGNSVMEATTVIYTEITSTFPEASFHREQVLSAIGPLRLNFIAGQGQDAQLEHLEKIVVIVACNVWPEMVVRQVRLQNHRGRVGVLHLCDENCQFDMRLYKNVDFVIRPYFRKKLPNNVMWIPGGLSGHIPPQPAATIAPIQLRTLLCSFSGSSDAEWDTEGLRSTRMEMFEVLNTRDGIRLGCDVRTTRRWGGQLSAIEYTSLLQNSKFALIPYGHHAETMRLYEALEMGAIPVMLKAEVQEDGHPLSRAPFLYLDSWKQLPSLLHRLRDDVDTQTIMQRRCHTWWVNLRLQLRQTLREELLEKKKQKQIDFSGWWTRGRGRGKGSRARGKGRTRPTTSAQDCLPAVRARDEDEWMVERSGSSGVAASWLEEELSSKDDGEENPYRTRDLSKHF